MKSTAFICSEYFTSTTYHGYGTLISGCSNINIQHTSGISSFYCRRTRSILRHTSGGLMIRVSVPDDDEQRVYLLPSGGGGQRLADCINRNKLTRLARLYCSTVDNLASRRGPNRLERAGDRSSGSIYLESRVGTLCNSRETDCVDLHDIQARYKTGTPMIGASDIRALIHQESFWG